MTITIITITKVSAADGKVLNDGKEFIKDVYLPQGDDVSKWVEVDEPQEKNENE